MQREIKAGLILRSLSEGFASDRENLSKFYVDTFVEAYGDDEAVLGPWVDALIAGNHPAMTDDDVWVVVNPAEGDRIVSALLLIPQAWRYDGIEVGVGRVELVGTNVEYRRKGLIRELMDVAHERSLALGHTMTAITGISHYYRRFGYTMGVELGAGAAMPLGSVPRLPADKTPEYTLRPASDADIPHLIAWDKYSSHQSLLTVVRDEPLWHYELHGRKPDHIWLLDILIITRAVDGVDVGYVALRQRFDETLTLLTYVVSAESSYLATFEDVLRGIKLHAETKYPENPPTLLAVDSGMPEALVMLFDRTYPARVQKRYYAWYMRVPSMAKFIQQIAPVLEARLVNSGAHCYTGTLQLNFFDLSGVRVRFENGKIAEAFDLKFATVQEETASDAAFPYNSFLNVLFGHRTFEDIEQIMPDTFVPRKPAILLSAMFPRKRSRIMPIA